MLLLSAFAKISLIFTFVSQNYSFFLQKQNHQGHFREETRRENFLQAFNQSRSKTWRCFERQKAVFFLKCLSED